VVEAGLEDGVADGACGADDEDFHDDFFDLLGIVGEEKSKSEFVTERGRVKQIVRFSCCTGPPPDEHIFVRN
jgi:hypothetical protein